MFKNYRVRVHGGKTWGSIGTAEIDEPTLMEKARDVITQ
jgi:hypothetical protein